MHQKQELGITSKYQYEVSCIHGALLPELVILKPKSWKFAILRMQTLPS